MHGVMPFEVSRRFCMLCRQQVFFRQERLPLSVYLFGCFCRWFRLPALEEPRSYGIFLSPGCACCGGAGLSPKSVHLELLPKPSGARLLREVGAAVKFLRSSRPAGDRQGRAGSGGGGKVASRTIEFRIADMFRSKKVPSWTFVFIVRVFPTDHDGIMLILRICR